MSDRPSEDERNSATFAALTMVLLVAGSLLALFALVIPDVLWILAVIVGMGLIAVLHYVIWGRWLAAALRDKEKVDAAFEDRSPNIESDSTPGTN